MLKRIFLSLTVFLISISYSQQLPADFWYIYLVTVPVYMIAYTWLMTVTLAYISEYLRGNRDITPGQVLGVAFKKIGKIIAATIITSIMTMFGMILLLIPGIYLAVATLFVSAIIIIEGDPTFESIARSIKLIKGKWWSTFGLVVIMGIVVGLMQLVFTIPTYINMFVKGIHQNLFAFDTGTIISNVISTLGISLLYPMVFIALAFQYFNLVERQESQGLKQQIDLAGQQVETAPRNEGEY